MNKTGYILQIIFKPRKYYLKNAEKIDENLKHYKASQSYSMLKYFPDRTALAEWAKIKIGFIQSCVMVNEITQEMHSDQQTDADAVISILDQLKYAIMEDENVNVIGQNQSIIVQLNEDAQSENKLKIKIKAKGAYKSYGQKGPLSSYVSIRYVSNKEKTPKYYVIEHSCRTRHEMIDWFDKFFKTASKYTDPNFDNEHFLEILMGLQAHITSGANYRLNDQNVIIEYTGEVNGTQLVPIRLDDKVAKELLSRTDIDLNQILIDYFITHPRK